MGVGSRDVRRAAADREDPAVERLLAAGDPAGLPGDQVRIGVDDAVVALRLELGRVDLEVEVRGRTDRVAGGADEADDVACMDEGALPCERREAREVGVVELVAGGVAEPEAVAADVVPADVEERPVGDRDERGPERAKMSFPWCQCGPRHPEVVGEGRLPGDREDVPASGRGPLPKPPPPARP